MAHFAELDENNVVLRVIVVHNNDTHDVDGVEDEALGQAFCTNLLGGNWKQTSYNGNIRKNYAGAGYTYDPSLDAFIPPKMFPSWLLDTSTCQWEPPAPYPIDGQKYYWDENTQSWVVFPVAPKALT